jgi:ribokinase
MSLLVVGCTVVDIIIPGLQRLPAWPEHTEFTRDNLVLLRDAPVVTVGGNGANAAYAAARCGAAVTLAGNGGTDFLGMQARMWLEQAGCRVLPSAVAKRTALNLTATNRRLERATFFYPGKRMAMPATTGGCEAALVCGWPHPPLATVARRFRAWRADGRFTAFDVGPYLATPPRLEAYRALFRNLDLLIANEHELRALTRADTLVEGERVLRGTFAGHVVIKRGSRGARWLPAGSAQAEVVRGKKVRAVNTVGAGDVFNGALLAALGRGEAFPPALRFANTVAASAVQSRRGALGLRVPA